MNFQRVQKKNRKAISPVLATVILIAITLIAAIAIAGFVFGLFGSFTSTPQISAVASEIPAPPTSAGPFAAACGGGNNLAVNTIVFQNTGSANGAITSIALTYAGHTQVATVTGCTVTSGGYATLTLSAYLYAGTSGSQFTGSVTTSSGGSVQFSGAFQ